MVSSMIITITLFFIFLLVHIFSIIAPQKEIIVTWFKLELNRWTRESVDQTGVQSKLGFAFIFLPLKSRVLLLTFFTFQMLQNNSHPLFEIFKQFAFNNNFKTIPINEWKSWLNHDIRK